MSTQERIEIIKQQLGVAPGTQLGTFAEVWCLDPIDSGAGFRRKFSERVATIKNSGLVIVGACSESPTFSAQTKEGEICIYDNRRGNLVAIILRNPKPE